MSVDYEVRVYNEAGFHMHSLGAFESIDWALRVNDIGACTFRPKSSIGAELFRKDGRLELWRSVDGRSPHLVGDTAWLIRRRQRWRDGVSVLAYAANHLLKRRHVLYAAGTSQASKSAAADDLCKAIVRENLGSSASDTARRISTDFLTVAADMSLGPTISKGFAWRNVFTVLQEITQASATAGTYLAFDVVKSGDRSLEFRTYIGQRGTDRRTVRILVFNEERGNLANAELTEDWSEEITHVTALGQGEGSDRATATASDSLRINDSPFNRIEDTYNANQTDNATRLADEADTQLRAQRQRVIFTGRVHNTLATQFGVNYNFGDYVIAEINGLSYSCRIDAASARVSFENNSGSQETLDIQLRAEIS